MTDLHRGDLVRFRDRGAHRIGTVMDIITAGRLKGHGVWRLRQRARIQFEADGQHWETHRDLTAITVAGETQPSLLTDEATN